MNNETSDFLNNSTELFTSDDEREIDKEMELDNKDMKLTSYTKDSSTGTVENEDKLTSKSIGYKNKDPRSGLTSQMDSLFIKALRNI